MEILSMIDLGNSIELRIFIEDHSIEFGIQGRIYQNNIDRGFIEIDLLSKSLGGSLNFQDEDEEMRIIEKLESMIF